MNETVLWAASSLGLLLYCDAICIEQDSLSRSPLGHVLLFTLIRETIGELAQVLKATHLRYWGLSSARQAGYDLGRK